MHRLNYGRNGLTYSDQEEYSDQSQFGLFLYNISRNSHLKITITMKRKFSKQQNRAEESVLLWQ